jgi:hypothetical protein
LFSLCYRTHWVALRCFEQSRNKIKSQAIRGWPVLISPKQTIVIKCKVFKSVHHRTIQIKHQPHATIFQFIILTFVYSSTYFGRFPVHHQELNDCSGSLWFYLRIMVIVVLCLWSGRSTGQPDRLARPRTLPDCHHDTKVKPEAATAVIELLIMGGKTPETC